MLQIKLHSGVLHFVKGKYTNAGRKPAGCWKHHCLDWVAVLHIYAKIHRAIHFLNFYLREKGKAYNTWLATTDRVFLVSSTALGTSHIFVSTKLSPISISVCLSLPSYIHTETKPKYPPFIPCLLQLLLNVSTTFRTKILKPVVSHWSKYFLNYHLLLNLLQFFFFFLFFNHR